MKKFALKSVVLAVGALAGASAFAAAVNLDASSPVSIKYAAEKTIGATQLLEDGVAADQTASVALGASFGADVTAYIRVDLSSNATFTGSPAISATGVVCATGAAGAAATSSVSQGGNGQSYVIFALSPAATQCLSAAGTVTIDTDTGASSGITVTDKNNVTMTYRLFETLTAAANPASNNTLKTKAATYISWANALAVTVTPSANATADVAATTGSYTNFTPTGITKLAEIGVALTAHALPDGTAVAAGDILEDTTKITWTGDFTGARSTGATPYDANAIGRVTLRGANCAAAATTFTGTKTLNATTMVIPEVAAADLATHSLCYAPSTAFEIVPADYSVTVDLTAKTGFAVSDKTDAAGKVVRNGVRMVAPLVQTTPGFLSRLVMTNTGSAARAYTVSAVSEDGVTVVLSGAGASGTLAAGKTTVIDLPSVSTITGATRTSLVVTVNAPQSEIDGLYQIVNPANGAISNHLLSYKN